MYPWLLCERIADAAWAAVRGPHAAPTEVHEVDVPLAEQVVVDVVGDQSSLRSPPRLPDADVAPEADARLLVRASAATQPRGAKFPHFVPMFKGSSCVFALKADAKVVEPHLGKVLHDNLRVGPVTILAGSKIVQVSECAGGPGPDLLLPMLMSCNYRAP